MDPKPSCDGVLLKCGNADTDKHVKKAQKMAKQKKPGLIPAGILDIHIPPEL